MCKIEAIKFWKYLIIGVELSTTFLQADRLKQKIYDISEKSVYPVPYI